MIGKCRQLVPIYGYGWVNAGQSLTRDTPAPFSVRLTQSSGREWIGIVETVGHEFEGRTVHMLNRYDQADGTVNVEVEGVADGWASVVEHLPSSTEE